jgi:hypothetical protein
MAVTWWIVLLLVNIVVNNPIGNSRQWAGTVLIGLVFSLRSFGTRAFRIAVPALVFVLSAVFPYLDYFRQTASSSSTLTSSGNGFDVLYAMSVKDYDASTQLVNTYGYVQQLGTDAGHQLLGVLFFFVPRSVWSGKPVDTGTLIAQWLANRANYNLSEPLWAELYLALGIPAVLIGFALLSRVSWRLDYTFGMSRRLASSANLSAVMVPVLAGYQLILLRGSLLQATGRLIVLLVVFWFVFPRSARPIPVRVRSEGAWDVLANRQRDQVPSAVKG